jgi:hypothetical protein
MALHGACKRGELSNGSLNGFGRERRPARWDQVRKGTHVHASARSLGRAGPGWHDGAKGNILGERWDIAMRQSAKVLIGGSPVREPTSPFSVPPLGGGGHRNKTTLRPRNDTITVCQAHGINISLKSPHVPTANGALQLLPVQPVEPVANKVSTDAPWRA